MRLSHYPDFPIFDFFGIFDLCFLSHVVFTLSSKAEIKSAQKSLKIFKTKIVG